MGKAAVNPELAVATDLEILAKLRLIVAMKHPDELLARKTLGHGLLGELGQIKDLRHSCCVFLRSRGRSCTFYRVDKYPSSRSAGK